MRHCSERFVGIDVAKAWNALAVADGERGGEVRFFGEVNVAEDGMRRVVKRIAANCDRAHFCYEAGPTGYGLHCLIPSLGNPCRVVAPSMTPRKPSDGVKINRPDAIVLAKVLRAFENVKRATRVASSSCQSGGSSSAASPGSAATDTWRATWIATRVPSPSSPASP